MHRKTSPTSRIGLDAKSLSEIRVWQDTTLSFVAGFLKEIDGYIRLCGVVKLPFPFRELTIICVMPRRKMNETYYSQMFNPNFWKISLRIAALETMTHPRVYSDLTEWEDYKGKGWLPTSILPGHKYRSVRNNLRATMPVYPKEAIKWDVQRGPIRNTDGWKYFKAFTLPLKPKALTDNASQITKHQKSGLYINLPSVMLAEEGIQYCGMCLEKKKYEVADQEIGSAKYDVENGDREELRERRSSQLDGSVLVDI
ncbi:hypothetical protein EDD85DRAFT_942831 [Armillaria nabsnona]|nr:hypothetical protein EDD85DRAFT_942831 [Armillaria nabsnona]